MVFAGRIASLEAVRTKEVPLCLDEIGGAWVLTIAVEVGERS